MRPEIRTIRRSLTAILLSLFLSLPALAEQWYVVSLAGQPVGSLQETVSEDAAGTRTENRIRMVLNRLGSRVEMDTATDVQESAEGRIQKASLDLKMSTQSTSTTAEVGDGAVRIRRQAGGQSFERTVPFSGDLLGPSGLRRLTQAR